MPNEFNIKNGFITSGNSNVFATLTARKLTGGSGNTNSGTYSFIGGGAFNTITASTSCFNSINSGVRNNNCGPSSFIGSGSGNTIGSNGFYSFIGAGCGNYNNGTSSFVGVGMNNSSGGNCSSVLNGLCNSTNLNHATILNGACNIVYGNMGFIGSGFKNTTCSSYTFIGNGVQNLNTESTYCPNNNSVIVGGSLNCTSSGYYGSGHNFIGGGCLNSVVASSFSTISGGYQNTASASFSFIGGGRCNTASNNYSTIVGGLCHIASGTRSFIGGGCKNTASNNYSTIVGGYNHIASGDTSFIGGGLNHISGGFISTVVGGRSNCALGSYSSILGGSGNTVTGSYSSAVGFGVTASANFTFYSNNLCGTTSINSPSFSGSSNTISGTKGTVTTSGSTSTAFINVSGSNTIGGTGYTDFIRVTNTAAGATTPTKTLRVNNIGGLEIMNNAYTAVALSMTDNGILNVGGGNIATTTSSDGTSNYLSFNGNNSQIYDDGNFHIHSRAANQAMWINANNGQINIGTQSPVAGGGIASAIAFGTGTANGYVTINTGRTVTTAANYGYLTTGGAGTYGGGSQSVVISLYANNRIWGQEIDAFSDERMKNIKGEISLEDGIKLVKNLIPIKYTWKEGDDRGIKAGYSAQQVIKSGFDHLIGLIPTEGLEETIDEDGFLSPKDTQFAMNYDQVTPYHGVVIKHLLEEIENLKNEIKELKNKVG